VSVDAMRRLLNLLIYITIGLAVSSGIIWYAYQTDPVPGNQEILRWGGLAANTALLFGFVISRAKPFWHAWAFWSSVVGVLVVHILLFTILLTQAEHWSASWFLFMYPIEVPLIAILSDWAVHASGAQPRYKRSAKSHPE
jgi:hypothetical protein